MLVELNVLLGSWEGTGSGVPGTSTVRRSYELILGGKFIQVASASKWAPTERHPEGELHEDIGFFSRDKTRDLLVLRQFHVEGFVNQYVAEVVSDTKIVLVTEAIENIPDGWRARETYTFLGPDEFVEQFELAAPGKDFEPYSENRLRRVAPAQS